MFSFFRRLHFEYTAKGVDKAKALDSVLIPMGYKKEEMIIGEKPYSRSESFVSSRFVTSYF